MEIYITKGIKQIGPHSEHEVRNLIDRGEVHEADLAWHEGLSDWVAVAEILQDTLKPDETAAATDLPSISESSQVAKIDPQPASKHAAENKVVPPPLPAATPSFLPSPESPGIASKSSTNNRGKMTAGILGILLGGFGVHKFYLGYTKEGVIQLIATFVTCGIAAILPLIEGIIYLTMSNEDFAKTYVIGRKGWL